MIWTRPVEMVTLAQHSGMEPLVSTTAKTIYIQHHPPQVTVHFSLGSASLLVVLPPVFCSSPWLHRWCGVGRPTTSVAGCGTGGQQQHGGNLRSSELVHVMIFILGAFNDIHRWTCVADSIYRHMEELSCVYADVPLCVCSCTASS